MKIRLRASFFPKSGLDAKTKRTEYHSMKRGSVSRCGGLVELVGGVRQGELTV